MLPPSAKGATRVAEGPDATPTRPGLFFATIPNPIVPRRRAMQALQKTTPAFGLELRDVPSPPAPGPGEVTVAVAAAGVCGTDLHIYEWTAGYEAMIDAMPVTLGHEFAGTIAAVGPGVAGITEG